METYPFNLQDCLIRMGENVYDYEMAKQTRKRLSLGSHYHRIWIVTLGEGMRDKLGNSFKVRIGTLTLRVVWYLSFSGKYNIWVHANHHFMCKLLTLLENIRLVRRKFWRQTFEYISAKKKVVCPLEFESAMLTVMIFLQCRKRDEESHRKRKAPP